MANGAIILATALPAAFFISAIPSIAAVSWKARRAPLEANQAILEDIKFIKGHTRPREPVAIISLNQGVLHGHTNTRSAIEGPGLAEMIRRTDLERQIDALVQRGPDKLFIGTDLDQAAENGLLGTNIQVDMNKIRSAYDLDETMPGGRLIFLKRRR